MRTSGRAIFTMICCALLRTPFMMLLTSIMTGEAVRVTQDGLPRQEGGLTYSVIVVRANYHNANLFADEARLRAYSNGVVSVQFVRPRSLRLLENTRGHLPFGAGHPAGVDRRIRIIHTWDLLLNHRTGLVLPDLSNEMMSHLKGACEDMSETTILLVKYDKRIELSLVWGTPSACWSNVAVSYPYNPPQELSVARPIVGPRRDPRFAYIPLGPTDSFPFVPPSDRQPTASRRIFVSVMVRTDTSIRRQQLMSLALQYEAEHPELAMSIGGPRLDARQYRENLLNSKFTISPRGLHPETFRLYESLEAGCIPIVSKNDFLVLEENGKHERETDVGIAAWNTVAVSPFVKHASVGTWEDLPGLLDRLQNEPPEVLAKLQADSIRWYEGLMNRTYTSLLNFGTGQDLFPQGGPIIVPGFEGNVGSEG